MMPLDDNCSSLLPGDRHGNSRPPAVGVKLRPCDAIIDACTPRRNGATGHALQ